MRVRGMLFAALGIVAAFALAPMQALATPQDVASTHAYIEANNVLGRAAVALINPVQKRIEAYDKKLASECPGVGTGGPENEASQPISHEVVVALWSIEFGAAAGPITTFQRKVAGLRWSNPATARAVATYARGLHELATSSLPPICADVSSWKASGFRVIPASALALVERIEAIAPTAVSPRLLAPYERGGDAELEKRTMRLEQRIEESEFLVGQGDWIQVLETLGMNQ
jgi:hypothetical protein